MAITTGVLISISWINPWQLLVLAGISGLLLAFDIPSRQSMLPKLIPRELLVNGIALYSLLFSGSAIIGPGFFAPLVHFGGIAGVFYIIGGSYVFTVLVMLLMDPELHYRDNLGYGFIEGLVGGMKYVKGNDLILTLIIVAVCFGTFGMSFETLIPMVAGNLLAGGVDVYSAMLLWLGLGGLSGTAVIGIKVSNDIPNVPKQTATMISVKIRSLPLTYFIPPTNPSINPYPRLSL
jgi:MFS family permease